MRLKYQLFFSLLLCGITLIALITAVNSWSFDRGFSKFVVESERQRLSPVVEQLAEIYQEQNGWGWVASQPQRIERLQWFNGFPRWRGEFGNRGNQSSADRAPRRNNNSPRTRSLILVDSDKNPLIGANNLTNRLTWEPILVDESVVGFIGIREPRGIPDGLANVFVRQQLRSNIVAALAMVLLSALLAIALASRLVKPILKINQAVGEISGGNYRHQIVDSSRNELGNLSKNINHLATTLDKNQHARQQWTAEISHELRTPVAVLQAEVEAMQDGIKPINREAIDSLHSETQRLSGLISDLHTLSMSDIGALDYRMAPVDLHALIHQRLTSANTQIEQADLSVSFAQTEKTCRILGDEKRLGQLIDNLIQNSIRYTDAGGQIKIAITEQVTTGQFTTRQFTTGQIASQHASLALSWSDSKPSVSDSQLSLIFNPLYRTDDSRNREYGGAGLGLAIVKKIADAHHASLSAHHAAEGGLEVRLNFPIEKLDDR